MKAPSALSLPLISSLLGCLLLGPWLLAERGAFGRAATAEGHLHHA